MVVVRRGDSLGVGNTVHARGVSNIRECAVTIVVEQLIGRVLVAHKEVEKAVVVDIDPSGSLRGGGRLGQARLAGYVRESAVAVVAQEGFPLADLPPSAQNQNVYATVIVVVRLHDIEASHLVGQAGGLGAVRKGPVAVVVEVVQGSALFLRRNHDIEQAIVFEIIYNHPARLPEVVQSRLGRAINEAADVLGRREQRGRQQVCFWDAIGIFA